jgi:YaiO family outer membrane protein
MIRLLPLTYIIIGILFVNQNLIAQNNVDAKQNTKSMFEKAKQLAFSGEREEARKICYEILQQKPKYYDARILIGRTFAWDKKMAEGRKELRMVLDEDFDNRDAIFAILDLEKWAGDIDKALFYCEYGQSFYPREERFLEEKAKLLQEKGLDEKSLQVINELLEMNPASESGRDLLLSYKSVRRKYRLIYKYDFEHFSEPYIRRWHINSLQLARRNSWGSLFLKMNIGDLVKPGESLWSKEIAKQFEIDAYPRISNWNYVYLNYGYSPDNLFPKHRAGFEWFQKLPASFEASAGMRFMQFDGSSGSKNVYLYTGSLGKYYRNYWFSFRTYLNPKNNDISQSYLLTTRRYLKDGSNYLGLELGTGVSPDEPRGNVSNLDTYDYDSWKVKLSYQDQLIEKRLTYLLRLGYEKEEYEIKKKRDIITFSVKLSYQL